MSRILVTGMSGTGKSSALAELGRRGYRVVDTDDPGWREYREYVGSSDELHRGDWLWVEERMTGLLDSDDGRSLFVQGCVRNQSKLYDGFDAVVLLSALLTSSLTGSDAERRTTTGRLQSNER
jgi:broad-specificity NMP kinase